MYNANGGFTLIELIVVIIILGILAATAVPKFVDLQTDANTAKNAFTNGTNTQTADVNVAKCVAGGSSFAACTAAFTGGTQ